MIFNIIGIMFGLLALGVSIFSIYEQVKSEAISRNIQTLHYCQQKYIQIEQKRLKYKYEKSKQFDTQNIISEAEIDSFFREFWTAKSDQFRYWLGGNIDHDTFMNWCLSIARHFNRGDEDFYGKSFMVGWANL